MKDAPNAGLRMRIWTFCDRPTAPTPLGRYDVSGTVPRVVGV